MSAASVVLAAEYPLGKPKIQSGMEIGMVYLQPIRMDPEGMMRKSSDSDIHLEADIHAVQNNPSGFAEGDWIPYLKICYELTKFGSNYFQTGNLVAMVASDGPHYGDNIKLAGPGKYHLKLFIAPPERTGNMAFGRHIDKETGVDSWFKLFKLHYDFPFAGIGKKGGY
ncbi:iron transporter [Candidatus Vallotia cooleyia]|uniref:iron transporter n=1 Tax=Candidatus Vallotiella adelgis TaxID=1177211 RepID=UPI001D02420F|nr:iron transporter [Candidatus Vallotia cooleyia]